MNHFTFSIFSIGAMLLLMPLVAIWQADKKHWKAKPIKPLRIGLVLLILAFSYEIFLSWQVGELKKFVDHPPANASPTSLEIFRSNIESSELLSKLTELVTIPLAVSLIVAALLVKSDLEFENEKKRFKDYRETVGIFERDLSEAVDNLQTLLNGNARGEPLLSAAKLVRARLDRLLYTKMKSESEFDILLESNLVEIPEKQPDKE